MKTKVLFSDNRDMAILVSPTEYQEKIKKKCKGYDKTRVTNLMYFPKKTKSYSWYVKDAKKRNQPLGNHGEDLSKLYNIKTNKNDKWSNFDLLFI